MVFSCILWHSIVFYGILWYYSVVFFGILWYSMVFYGIVWYSLVFYGILLHSSLSFPHVETAIGIDIHNGIDIHIHTLEEENPVFRKPCCGPRGYP